MPARAVYVNERDVCVLNGAVAGASDPCLPELPERACAIARARYGLEFGDARARAGFGRGHLLHVVVYTSELGRCPVERVREAAASLVRDMVGAACFEQWIAEVDVAPLGRPSSLPVLDSRSRASSSYPLEELPRAVRAAVDGLLAGLPDEPTFARLQDATWTMFELTPEVASDYAAQDDLVLATTSLPEMLRCYLQGAPFSSARFSRHDETFCYLKYADPELDAERRVAERRRLEDALNEALVAERLGCVVGAGLGVRYSYVNLGLLQLTRALDQVRRVARAHPVPNQAWILFCETSWAESWIGVWTNPPPPPAPHQ